MDGIVALLLSKKFTKDTVIGMGAIKGAACQVQSINKVGKTTTITLKWEDNVGVVHTQAFDIEDGLDGVSVQNATIKPNGHLELTLSDGNTIDCGKVLPQYDTMPTPSSSNEGQILQYIGTTTSNYTNGYFYQCVESPVGSRTYVWVQKNVQPNNGGGGGDGVVDGYYNSADQLFYEDSAFLNPITGEDNTIYVDLNTNGLYRYDGTIFIKVSSSTDSYTKAEIGDLSDLPDTSKNVIENIDLLSENIDLLDGSVLTIKTDITQLQGSLANKVDKITGKSLSTNDYTDDDKEKLVKLSPIYLIGSGLNLDSITGELTASGIDVPIDAELSDTSINPVQNKVITTKIEQLEASKLSLSDIDNALSGSSINPVQNQIVTLAIDQLQGSVLNKIQKMLGAQEDNFTVIDNNGGVKDSGISKDVVPITASASNKLLVASDLSTYQEKLTEGDGIDIDTNNKISVDISYLTASRVGYIPSSEKGAHSGVAELDSTGKVPSSQLPSYIDDVIDGYYNDTDGKFYEDSAYTTEIVGESGKIYISVDTDIQYRWTGTAFAALGGALQLGETSSTAYRGDRGKIAYDHSQIKDGSNPHNTTADNVNLKVPIPALSGSKLDVESTLYGVNTELGKKADKVDSATNGNLAGLDSNGNLTDSGVTASDVVTKVSSAVSGNLASLNSSGGIVDSGVVATHVVTTSSTAGLIKNDGTIDTNTYATTTALGDKADKVTSATANDFAALDSNGNLVDSGINKNIVPSGATSSNKLATANDIPTELNDLSVDVEITSPVNAQVLTYNSTSGKWENQTGSAPVGGATFQGSILFANLPTTGMANGDWYDIKDSFTTDNRFEEGSGISCGAGTDVIWVNADSKWNILTPSGVYSFNGRSGAVVPASGDYTASDVGLGNVVNTGDSDTPTSGGTTKFTTGGAYTELNKKYDINDTAETTIDNDDYFPFYDTSATGKRKTLWSNIKSVLKTYFDTIYASLSSLDEWTTSYVLAEGTTSKQFTGLNSSYAYDVYFECASGYAPPTLITPMVINGTTATAYFTSVTNSQAGTSGNSCKIRLRIIK